MVHKLRNDLPDDDPTDSSHLISYKDQHPSTSYQWYQAHGSDFGAMLTISTEISISFLVSTQKPGCALKWEKRDFPFEDIARALGFFSDPLLVQILSRDWEG